ncbi:hypothetical protein FRC18_012426 [Serendipita sp. 400]|nr:hypothetical protein FRC18_012426 [Serendipita sp. 400]
MYHTSLVCISVSLLLPSGHSDSFLPGGGVLKAEDKIFQHNGAGTVSVSNFYAIDFGKLYRPCGNCSTLYKRNVILNNVKLVAGDSGVGVNTNFGGTARLTNVCSTGKPTVANVCCKYQGTTPGNEPTKIGCGADSTSCIYSNVGTC